ncbi:MAG: DUF4388 domain-containing protein [Myxococcota bacterium]|jgi:Domain of unknown function (DUF4388)|nr:DUF4388 domain-containing protein [Myxococcota bacterium]
MREPRAELVRIDSRGEAHPIGTVASQRLRARAGTFRLLPSPPHIVFLRYTGEDGRRDAEDGAIVRLAGEITAPGALADVIALVGQAGLRGELAVASGDSVRSIFFDRGEIVGAVTDVEDERIGSILYRFGAIDARARDEALAHMTQGQRFGEVVVMLGMVSQETLYRHISKQIEEILFATLGVSDGAFYFLDGFDDARLPVRHSVNAGALLMDCVTRMDELTFFRQKIPSAEHVPALVDGHAPPPGQGGVFGAIDGRRSILELGRIAGLGEFETTKQVFALVQSHHVVIRPPRVTGGPAAIVAAANGVLEAVFRATHAAGKSGEVSASLSAFASGAGVYDVLFRGAGPDDQGKLAVDKVAANAGLFTGDADASDVLKRMLHDYVSFALFSAGAALGASAEAALLKSVREMLAVIKP